MLGEPEPCTREPTHSASSGLPVHTLIVVMLIRHTSTPRLRRPSGESGSAGREPAPVPVSLEVPAFICSTVSEYTYECEYPESGPTNACRAAREDTRGPARCGWRGLR